MLCGLHFAEVESSGLESGGKEIEIIAVTAWFQVRYYFLGKMLPLTFKCFNGIIKEFQSCMLLLKMPPLHN